MRLIKLKFTIEGFNHYLWALACVVATTLILYLIGRNLLGEGVIALLYLLPIGWATSKWGRGAGVFAAMIAALAFDFLFIPPFYTFTVGSVEGWLILIIFLVVSVVIVGRIQAGLTQAEAREREAVFMYELSVDLAGQMAVDGIARVLATHIQTLYQAKSVQVIIQPHQILRAVVTSAPPERKISEKPDLVVPIMTALRLVGDISIWGGETRLPAADSRLLRNFAAQCASALERVWRNQPNQSPSQLGVKSEILE